jgi:hypothetical protein
MTSNGSALRFSSRCTVCAAQRTSPALMTVSADFAVFGDGTDVRVGEENNQSVKGVFVHRRGRSGRNASAHDTQLRIADYHLVVAGRNLGGSA